MTRGEIHSIVPYVQAKMLNHSGWNGRLPRRITPSDIDMVFDNRGYLLFVEVTRNPLCCSIGPGQQRLQESIINANPERIVFATAVHHVEPSLEVQIDTVRDIVEFRFLAVDTDGGFVNEVCEGNDRWVRFVDKFFRDPVGFFSKIRTPKRSLDL